MCLRPFQGASTPFLPSEARLQAERLRFTPGDIACMEGSILAAISIAKLHGLAISNTDAKLHREFLCRISDPAIMLKRRPVIVQKVDDRGMPTQVWLMTTFEGKKLADVKGVHLSDIAVVSPTKPYNEDMLTALTTPTWQKIPQYIHLIPISVGVQAVTIWGDYTTRVTGESFSKLSQRAKARALDWQKAPLEDLSYDDAERRKVDVETSLKLQDADDDQSYFRPSTKGSVYALRNMTKHLQFFRRLM